MISYEPWPWSYFDKRVTRNTWWSQRPICTESLSMIYLNQKLATFNSRDSNAAQLFKALYQILGRYPYSTTQQDNEESHGIQSTASPSCSLSGLVPKQTVGPRTGWFRGPEEGISGSYTLCGEVWHWCARLIFFIYDKYALFLFPCLFVLLFIETLSARNDNCRVMEWKAEGGADLPVVTRGGEGSVWAALYNPCHGDTSPDSSVDKEPGYAADHEELIEGSNFVRNLACNTLSK